MREGNKLIKLTGRRINKLTVIGRTKNKYSKVGTYWDCKCDCGTVKSLRSDVLRKTDVKSCGCTLDHVKIGDKVGNLKVVEGLGRIKKGRSFFWRCKCDCGSNNDIIL